jgi:hypothetical protein
MLETYKGRNVKRFQKVAVHRNLNNGLFSIKDPKTGLVLAHGNSFILSECTFVVREKSRQRVLSEKRKNVHAWIEGKLIHILDINEVSPKLVEIYYNPYETKTFINKETKEELKSVSGVLFIDGKAYYIPEFSDK